MTEPGPRADGGVAPVARKAAELRRLELLVTRRLDGLLRGEFLGVQPGPGTDFAGSRDYEAGDDARRIDWNLTARSLAPQIRTTDADRELQTWVIVDRSASMNFGTTVREKADVAFAAVAAFGFLTARHGNQFGVMVAGGDRVTRLGPSSTRTSLMATLSRLYDVPRREDRPGPDADLIGALGTLERARPRRGQVIVISDFLDGGDWHRSLGRLALQHQVLAVQVVDRRELELPTVGMLTLVDAETGREITVQSGSSALRERYARAARERDDAIGRKIREAGCPRLVLATDSDWLLDIVRFVVGSRTLRRAATTARDQRVRAPQLRSAP
ncbi:MAG TPA: DUF58 domain-containing protein [Acidimicrobiia bacterium]|nr:DUF58 domain-containing protein [Acidimicrobiia bacterium]